MRPLIPPAHAGKKRSATKGETENTTTSPRRPSVKQRQAISRIFLPRHFLPGSLLGDEWKTLQCGTRAVLEQLVVFALPLTNLLLVFLLSGPGAPTVILHSFNTSSKYSVLFCHVEGVCMRFVPALMQRFSIKSNKNVTLSISFGETNRRQTLKLQYA